MEMHSTKTWPPFPPSTPLSLTHNHLASIFLILPPSRAIRSSQFGIKAHLSLQCSSLSYFPPDSINSQGIASAKGETGKTEIQHSWWSIQLLSQIDIRNHNSTTQFWGFLEQSILKLSFYGSSIGYCTSPPLLHLKVSTHHCLTNKNHVKVWHSTALLFMAIIHRKTWLLFCLGYFLSFIRERKKSCIASKKWMAPSLFFFFLPFFQFFFQQERDIGHDTKMVQYHSVY